MTTNSNSAVTSRQGAFGKITPEMVADARARVGKEMSPLQPYVEMANKDAIRHWAEGLGDMNPLWVDEAYARKTRWGDIIAPPTMVFCLSRNFCAASMRGFPGIHSWQLGNSFEWHDVIRRNAEFTDRSVMESVEEARSSYAGGVAYDQTIRTEFIERGSNKLICTGRQYIRRFERNKGQETAKYKRTKQTWTESQILEVAEKYRQEEASIRGALPRHVEDVQVRDELPSIVRGPLTVTDCVTFNLGWGGAYSFAHGIAYRFLRKAPGAFPVDDSGVPDAPERTHWIDSFAQRIGAPAAFDYGPQRLGWCVTLVTNWMGDDAFLQKFAGRILRPNYHGDLVTVSGAVTGVDIAKSTVDIAIQGVNQLDELVCNGTATVLLPRRNSR